MNKTCQFCRTVATPNDEQNCTSLEEAYRQTPKRPYGCPWFDKDSRKMYPRPADAVGNAPPSTSPLSENGNG